MKILNYAVFIIVSAFVMSSCNKEASSTSTFLTISMTKGSAPYNEVNLDVQAVEITGLDGSKVLLNTHAGIYNLLDDSNGKDILIAKGQLEMKYIVQIRLILGSNNTLVKDNVSYPLILPSSGEPGLIVQVYKTLDPGLANFVVLDIDLNNSITSQVPGNFIFQPLFRAVNGSLTGSIRGQIVPGDIRASVRAVTKGTYYYSFVSATGNFIIKGLQPDMYSITVFPASPFTDITVNDINVKAGMATNVGLVHLQCDFCVIKERF